MNLEAIYPHQPWTLSFFMKVLHNFKQHSRSILMDLLFTWKLCLLQCERRIINLATLCHSVFVIGAETLSESINKYCRNLCMKFTDLVAAMVCLSIHHICSAVLNLA